MGFFRKVRLNYGNASVALEYQDAINPVFSNPGLHILNFQPQ